MKIETRNLGEAHVKALAASGLSRAAYCQQHDVRYDQLHRWQVRLAKGGVRRQKPSAFVRARQGSSAQIERDPDRDVFGVRLVVGKNAVFEFPLSTDPRWVAELAVAVGGLAR